MIRQKNGELKAIDKNRIINAVKKANNKFQELKETDINDIADYIDYKCGGDKEFELDEVNDLIENQIMIRGAYNTARTYDRNRMNKNRDTDIQSIDRKANKETIKNLQIRKKNGTLEPYSVSKLLSAVSKSAVRARDNENITDEESTIFITLVENDLAKMVKAENTNIIPTGHVHMLVEKHLDYVAPDIGKAYSNYRSFRLGQAKIWENIRGKCTVLISNDKDTDTMTQKNQNANADSQLTSTQKCFFADYTGEGYYEDQFLTKEERQIAEDGYLYWHDKNARILAPLNCCLWRMDYVLKHGFQMNGVWYNQPKSLDTAFDVIGDLTLMAASQQYGGFTIPRIDSLLVPYAEKTYQANIDRYMAKGIIKETARQYETWFSGT